ncbi:uncharacterized protein LOC117102488 [Anneissia japonica]|uniref:uncharacterized protein LOC117102488 n=1 Tax=Anneissia japonica TaxID=1529436 RepID=UPI001425A077|nr:uncharacterized protein LOC117102488 [Anneissia japonica]
METSRHLSGILIITLFSMIHAQTSKLFTNADGESYVKVSTITTYLPSTLHPRIVMVSTRTEERVTMGRPMTTDITSKGTGNEDNTPLPLAVSLAAALVVAMAVVIICVVVRIKYKRSLAEDNWTRTSKVQKGVNSAENGLSNHESHLAVI